jgi:hypothetical protein
MKLLRRIINEEKQRRFRVHYRWQAPETKLDIYSHRESGFKNPTILAIALVKSNIEEIKDLKKSKIQEVEV